MSVKNFWTIFLKILGIWLIVSSFTPIAQFFSSSAVLAFQSNSFLSYLSVFSVILSTITLYVVILWLFVYKTAWLIQKLRLEDGFTKDKIELNLNYTSILTIAIIVIGGLIFVDSLPMFCQETFNYFKQKRMFDEEFSSGWIFFYLVKTLIAYLAMTNSRWIVKFFESKIEENSTKND